MEETEILRSEADRRTLPLKWFTPTEWVAEVMSDSLALLNDHAHLERKAALNALDVLLRWPNPTPPENWVQAMTSIALDEVSHLQTASRLLARRGGELKQWHGNSYASDLQKLVRRGQGNNEIADRLLISALIEARSCERFCLLADLCDDEELKRLYGGLWKSEAGHYRVFLSLARDLPRILGVEDRWEQMLDEEAQIIQRQPVGPRMHSGLRPD